MRHPFNRPPVTAGPEPTWWMGDALVLLLAVCVALLAVVLGASPLPSTSGTDALQADALQADAEELPATVHTVTLVRPLPHAAPDLPRLSGPALADAVHAALPAVRESSQAAFLDVTVLDALGPAISIATDDHAIRFRVANDTLFAAAGASLTAAGQAALQPLVAVLQRHDVPVTIEGHADSVPIRSQRYPSNWELSASRAISVLRYLEGKGIAATRLHASGYADTRPIAGNESPAGQAANRRIEIVVALPPRPSVPAPAANDVLTTGQSASLAVHGEIKRGSHSTEPKAPLTGGGEVPTVRSEFFTTSKRPIMQTFPRLQSARHDFRPLQPPVPRPA